MSFPYFTSPTTEKQDSVKAIAYLMETRLKGLSVYKAA